MGPTMLTVLVKIMFLVNRVAPNIEIVKQKFFEVADYCFDAIA